MQIAKKTFLIELITTRDYFLFLGRLHSLHNLVAGR